MEQNACAVVLVLLLLGIKGVFGNDACLNIPDECQLNLMEKCQENHGARLTHCTIQIQAKTIDFNCRAEKGLNLTDVDGVGKFFVMGDKPVSWYRAASICEAKGLALATIETLANLTEVVKTLKEIKEFKDKSFWVSANDIGREPGKFYWLNDRRVLYEVYSKNYKNNVRNDGTDSCTFFSTGGAENKIEIRQCDAIEHLALCKLPKQCTSEVYGTEE